MRIEMLTTKINNVRGVSWSIGQIFDVEDDDKSYYRLSNDGEDLLGVSKNYEGILFKVVK